MPPALARAHQALDRAVDRCYRPQPFATELARLEFLFGLYQQLSAPLVAVAQAGKARRNLTPPTSLSKKEGGSLTISFNCRLAPPIPRERGPRPGRVP